jgi:hypothetical protein
MKLSFIIKLFIFFISAFTFHYFFILHINDTDGFGVPAPVPRSQNHNYKRQRINLRKHNTNKHNINEYEPIQLHSKPEPESQTQSETEAETSETKNIMEIQQTINNYYKQFSSEITLFSILLSTSQMTKIQYTILNSWENLFINIILFVKKREQCNLLFAQYKNIKCLLIQHICIHTIHELDHPLINCIFNLAHEHSQTKYMSYVNEHILLDPSVTLSFYHIYEQYQKQVKKSLNKSPHSFVLVCQTIDLILPLSISNNIFKYQYLIVNLAHQYGTLHSNYDINLIIYEKNIWKSIEFPPFLAGQFRWDNW